MRGDDIGNHQHGQLDSIPLIYLLPFAKREVPDTGIVELDIANTG